MHRFYRIAGVCAALAWRAVASAASVLSDDYATREWHVSDGLPNEQIGGVIQDDAGFLWVSTINGTVRFDGSHFEDYPLEREGLSYARIAASSPSLGLVVAPYLPRRGLVVLRDGHFQPWRPEEFHDRVITALFTERNGALWIAADDGGVARFADNQLQRFAAADGLPPGRSRWFASDARGNVWMASAGSIVRFREGKFVPLQANFGGSELRIGSSTQGGPWVVTPERVLRIEGDQVIEVAKLPSLLGAHYIQAMAEDRRGTLWLGTRSQGLHVLSEGALEQVPTSHEDIFSLCEDRDGNMWAGTNGGGLNRIRRKSYRLYDKSAGLLDNLTHTVTEDARGNVWFANRDGGVARVHDGAIDVLAQRPGWQRLSAISIFPFANGEMGVTAPGGVYALTDRNPMTLRRLPELPGSVRVTYAARNGDVWFSGEPTRVGRFHGGRLDWFGPAEGMDGRQVRGIAEDAAGRIWVGAAEGKLFRFGGARFESISLGGLNPGSVQAIRIDDDGTIWLGTVTGGIVVVRDGRVRSCTAKEGLPDSNITQILADAHGYLWFGSKRGVFRLNRQEILDCLDGKLPRVTPLVIGQDEGLKDLSCQGIFQPGACESRDGRLWFATRRGVLCIDPGRPLAAPMPPPVAIEEVRFDGQRVPLGRPFTVTSNVRKLEIRFGVLALSAPERVHARYRLDGFDDDWVTALPSRVASYPRLPPGGYRFHVVATGGDGAVNLVGDTVEFTVEPMWWQTWWFRVGAIVAGTLCIVVVVRAWSHRRLRQKLDVLERERAIERERRRIAQNIHDDLGASLTRISLLTQHARHENTSGAPYYDQIHTTAADITRSMDEIVWAVNPKYDHLESLAGYIGDFAQNFLRVAGIRCRLDIPPEMPYVPLTSQTRHHLFLCCKEALNNVVKHAGADEVVVAIRAATQEFVIEIRDNGCGYRNDAPGGGTVVAGVRATGMGVESIRQRMTGIGGTFEIAPAKDGGTVVTLTMLFARGTS